MQRGTSFDWASGSRAAFNRVDRSCDAHKSPFPCLQKTRSESLSSPRAAERTRLIKELMNNAACPGQGARAHKLYRVSAANMFAPISRRLEDRRAKMRLIGFAGATRLQLAIHRQLSGVMKSPGHEEAQKYADNTQLRII